MLSVRIRAKMEKARAKLLGLDKLLEGNITEAMNQMRLALVRTSKTRYLSGPRPKKLGVKNDQLRSSIRAVLKGKGDRRFIVLGTDVKYAQIHEEGLTIRAHKRTITQAFGRPLKSPVTFSVRSFKMPKRPFLAPSISDNENFFKKEMLRAVRLAAQGARA